jgi:TetR/AcrR family transcriptional regulator
MSPDNPVAQVNPMSEAAMRIVRCAAPLFAQKGYSGVSIHEIACASGGSKANIFHHFPNKEGLYLAVMRTACGDFGNDLNKLAEAGGDGRNHLRLIARQHFGRMISDPDTTRLILREIFDSESEINRSLVADILHQNFALIVDQIEEMQTQGHIRSDANPALVAMNLLAVNSFIFHSWKVIEQFEEFRHLKTPQACADAAFETITKGLFAK